MLKNILVNFLVILGCIFSLASLQKSQLDNMITMTPLDYIKQEKTEKIQLKILSKLPSFGFNHLIADAMFLNFIQYYGDVEGRRITGYGLLPEYYRSVISFDSRFVKAHLYLESATTLFAGRPDVSVEILDYGLNSLSAETPSAYQLWISKGVNELLFLGETKEAQKSFHKGSQWAIINNTQESMLAAKRAKETAEFLADNPDSRLARASSWLTIYINAREDEVRELALKNIYSLGAVLKVKGNKISVSIPDEEN